MISSNRVSSELTFLAKFKETKMKTANFAKGLLLGASLLLASAAVAGEKATLKLFDNVTINGKTLPAGKYDVAWDGTGPDVQINIRQGKEIIATVPATIETSATAPDNSGYSTNKENGSVQLTNIFFAGKKYALNLGQQAATSAQVAPTTGNK
jgi:hypothetical protein